MKSELYRRAILFLLCCAFALLIAVAERAPMHLEKQYGIGHISEDFAFYLNGVVGRTLPGPYVYRILVPYSVAGLHALLPSLAPVNIDFVLKVFFLVLAQIAFYIYLRLFFPPVYTLAGVFMLDIYVAFALSAIQGPSIMESSDLLNLFVFSAALIAIHQNSPKTLIILLFAGTFNRETTWMILPVLLADDLLEKRTMMRSAAALAAVAVPYIGIRLLISVAEPQWFTLYGLQQNIPFLAEELTFKAVVANIHVFMLLGPLLILSAVGFRSKPRFLRVAAVITPLFILVHYVVGTVIEGRLWMPLFVILIPLTLQTLRSAFDDTLPPEMTAA